MRKAVEAVIREKERRLEGVKGCAPFGKNWKPAFSKVSNRTVEATVAYCEYLWKKYGRFPAQVPRFKTVVGFQAGHLDLEFFDRFYKPDYVSESHREVFQKHAVTRKPRQQDISKQQFAPFGQRDLPSREQSK